MNKTFLLTIAFLFILFVSYAQNKIAWNAGVNLTTNTYSNMHPRVALDRAGNPLIIWGRMSDESVFFSRWNGTLFTTPVKLNPSWLTVATASWMGPDIATKGDTIYVVMKRTPEASDTCHIYMVHSFNGGVSFSAPVRVDFIADSISRFPTVAIDATGNPVVGFMKFNSSFLKSRWVITKSSDFGNTFSKDILASGFSGPTASVCDCCPGALAVSGNVSAMIYRDNLSDLREIWSGISTNNSTSFASGFKVDNTNWMINSCPASGPSGVIVGDSLYSVFMSSGTGSYRTYLSKSSISGGSVKSVNNLTGAIPGLSQQNYPRIATDGKAAAIVWKQTVSGNAQLPILFTNNITKGFPIAFDTVDLADITNADVALGNGKVYVVWEDDNSGTIKYRTGSFTPATGITENFSPNLFSMYPNPVTDMLTLEYTVGEDAFVSIRNILGQEIEKLQLNKAELTIQINTVSMQKGIYFISLHSNGNSITKKFVKE